jgi:hypothetical protein
VCSLSLAPLSSSSLAPQPLRLISLSTCFVFESLMINREGNAIAGGYATLVKKGSDT